MKYIICSKDKQKNLKEKLVFLFSMVLLFSFQASLIGQIKPLDNWDLEVIGKGKLQSETYFDMNFDEPVDIIGLNQLLRYGLSKNFELQVDWHGVRYDAFPVDLSTQVTRVGVKAYLLDQSKYLPGISLIGSVNLTVNPDVTPIFPALNILFRKKLIENFTLTGNYHLRINEQDGDFLNTYAANLDVELTNWLMTYVGIKARNSLFSVGSEDPIKHYLEIGTLFWIADGLRLYPFYNIGIDDNAGNVLNIGVLYTFK